jgi:hypothetical protein
MQLQFQEAAQEYMRKLRLAVADRDGAEEDDDAGLPPAHLPETPAQGRQRAITLASFAQVTAARPDVQVFNKLLVQYPRPGRVKTGQVLPDNMIVVHSDTIKVTNCSFDVPGQPVGPFCVLEYVALNNLCKDYAGNGEKYELELKVPYFLVFGTDRRELALYRHNQRRYVAVKPNARGRLPIPKLELEVAILDGWVRFWFRGELLLQPAEQQRELDKTNREIAEITREIEDLRRKTAAAEEETGRVRARQAKQRPKRNP